MLAAELEARMVEAGGALEGARQWLVRPSPESLEACRAALGTAAAGLADCKAGLEGHAGDAALIAQAVSLRVAVRNAGVLLETAAEHHRKWFQILRAKMGGYTAGGQPTEISRAGRVCLQG